MGLFENSSQKIGGFFRSLVENIVAETGGRLYATAASVISRWNRDACTQPLDDYQKRHLRPLFGSLVDRVQVTYQSRLWEEVKVFGITIGTASSAQTFGHRIYIREEYRSCNRHQLFLLAHELVHVRQYEQADRSLARFGNSYFRGYHRAGFNYRNNTMEQEAYNLAGEFAAGFVEEQGECVGI